MSGLVTNRSWFFRSLMISSVSFWVCREESKDADVGISWPGLNLPGFVLLSFRINPSRRYHQTINGKEKGSFEISNWFSPTSRKCDMSSISVINTEQKVNTGKKKNTKRKKSVNTEEENCWNYLLNLFRYKYLFVFFFLSFVSVDFHLVVLQGNCAQHFILYITKNVNGLIRISR